jgi:CheY-like chemotaxis protein
MPHKLLLADDSVTIQRVIELTFADEDVQVITVGDGREAIDRIQADRPDIILADVGMPERDGYEVAAFVKNDPALAVIPVLLLTGAFEPVDEERARAAGCDGVLAKPFEPQMVITRVKELLAGGGAHRTLPPAATTQTFVSVDRIDQTDTTVVPPIAKPPARAVPEPPRVEAREESAPPPGPDFESVRIGRRAPLPIQPPAAPEQPEALDDYFDRLDAAFATLNRVSAPDPAPAAAASIRPMAKPVLSDFPFSDEAPTQIPGLADRDDERPFDLSFAPAPAPAPPPPALAPLERELDHASARFTQPAVTDPVPAAEPVHSPVMAQAFSALLAAERGDPAPPVSPIVLGSAAVTDDFIEQVTQRILERLTDRVVRETVADIVSNVAERIVRSEIDRVKASLK